MIATSNPLLEQVKRINLVDNDLPQDSFTRNGSVSSLETASTKCQADPSSGQDSSNPPPKANTTMRTATRLVVCVDGTWGEPDGTHNDYSGNISNTFRTFLAVRQGESIDASGRSWRQVRKYFKGLNNLNSFAGKWRSGAFGAGLPDQIKEVYEYCCEHAPEPDDEIYLFGFSRGAFAIRAVANLLHYVKYPKAAVGTAQFDAHYQESLRLYRDIREGTATKRGAMYDLMDKTKEPAVVKFLGAFDTVKAFNDDNLYDISPVSSVEHFRHALALHEEKVDFSPEIWKLEGGDEEFQFRSKGKYSLLQAWFLGTHSDLSGANQADGLSLYPLQWILSEAETVGLVLGFTQHTYKLGFMKKTANLDNPLALLFEGGYNKEATKVQEVVLENSIKVRMWDMASTHKEPGYSVKINKALKSWIFTQAPRAIFDQTSGRLLGYYGSGKRTPMNFASKTYTFSAPYGTFIHPSAYMVYDTNILINTNSDNWHFKKGFLDFRRQCIPDENNIFWHHSEAVIDETLKVVRILVCGNAGIGKSTLLNRTTGVVDFVSVALPLENQAYF